MPMFECTAYVRMSYSAKVEADTREEAQEIAECGWESGSMEFSGDDWVETDRIETKEIRE